MQDNAYFNKEPFNTFPFKTFLQVIDKLAYLNDVSSPYEVSPGTDLCVSDTNYSLGFLVYLHAFGRVIKDEDKWKLEYKGKIPLKKPYRFTLIEDAVKILNALKDGNETISNIKNRIPDLSEEVISDYLNVLLLLSQQGRIKQHTSGWDATFSLIDWNQKGT
ncbi:MAG: hypothetical protein ACFFAU_15900 [Candidatus Hodarchaeota archaeon]